MSFFDRDRPGSGAEDERGASTPGSGSGSEPGSDPNLASPPAIEAPAEAPEPSGRDRAPAGNMLPGRERRRFGIERILTRLIATCGVIAIGVALGAILVSSKTQGWVVGLVVAIVSVVLSGILWSSRQL